MRPKYQPYSEQELMNLFYFIIDYKTAHDGLSPPYSVMVQKLGISSTSVVALLLSRLARRGLIKQANRGIMVIGGRWSYEPKKM